MSQETTSLPRFAENLLPGMFTFRKWKLRKIYILIMLIKGSGIYFPWKQAPFDKAYLEYPGHLFLSYSDLNKAIVLYFSEPFKKLRLHLIYDITTSLLYKTIF